MKRLLWIMLAISFMTSSAFAQSNKIVFGPLVGDDAGVLTVRNGEDIEIEMWVRTDPDNPAPIVGVMHCLMSADTIIASRNGAIFDPDYGYPCWDTLVSPPYGHPDDPNIPEGHTMQAAGSIFTIFDPPCDVLDTDGAWDYYGSFLITCNTNIPIEETYYPLSAGWFPHSGQGTSWAFEAPPGGSIQPEEDYCGLYFVPQCDYIPGDCNHNGIPWELSDVIAMIGFYRGTVEPFYTCYCPPHSDYYPPDADPDGNCVPYELSDLIIMIRRGIWPPIGCLDCPPPGRTDWGNGDKENIVPTLKLKAKIERKSFTK